MMSAESSRRRARGAGPIGLFARHPTAANLLMLAMLFIGWAALEKLNTQFFPDFSVDVITVDVVWPGASAEDVDSNIVQAIEPELRFLDGVDTVSSTSYEGLASIVIEYEQGANMQSALSAAEAAVSRVTTLPQETEQPEVSRFFAYETIGRIVLSGALSREALQAFARRMRDELLARGVDRIDIEGARTPEIWIEPAAETLRRLDLTLRDVADAVAAASQDSPLGDLAGGDRQFRALGQVERPDDLRDIAVRAFADGRRVRLDDIARIDAAWEEGEVTKRRNGQMAIELHVQRSVNADALELQQVVVDYLADARPLLPPSLTVETYQIAADLIRQRVDLLLTNAVSGLILVLAVLFFFLNARVAIWVAIGIPTAIAATFAIMLAMGQSINMLSLFGLIMALGIIVDDAIVVGEHAEALHAAGGDPTDAAVAGARRMAPPVFSSSLTTVCAFLPLLIIGGIIGTIIAAIPLVIIAVLVASLIECFLVLPGHLRHAFVAQAKAGAKGRFGRFREAFDARFIRFRDGTFRRIVGRAMDARYVVVAGAFGAFLAAIGLVAGGHVGFQFFPSPESDSAFANVEMAAGTSRAQTVAMLEELERALYQAADEAEGPGNDLIVMAVASVGTSVGGGGAAENPNGTDTLGGLKVELRTADDRDVRMRDFLDSWRAKTQALPGLETLTIRAPAGGPPGRDVDVRLTGGDPATLKAASEEVKALLRGYPGVLEIDDNLPFGKPETIFELTPRGRALGLELNDVAAQLRGALEGEIADRFPRGEEEVTVRVRQPAEALDAAAVDRLFLRAPGGAEAPLAAVVSRTESTGFARIIRQDGAREVAIQADVDPAAANTQSVIAALEQDGIAAIAARHGLDYRFKGKAEEMAETFGDMQLGAILGLAGIYIVLAWVFGSYARPLAVLAIIPLGFIGAVIGHLVMGFDLTILSMIGIIGLSGIVVNDSIVLVSTIDERMKTTPPREAVIDGSCDRLRAVLLTSFTTIGGLTPLLFETSLQAQFLIPMALTFVFGLLTATVLVLIIAPAIALIQHDVGDVMKRRKKTAPAA